MILGFQLSLYKWELASIGNEIFVGAQNYLKMFRDHRFVDSVQFTLFYAVVAVSIEVVLGTILALVLNQPIKGMRIFSTILLAPTALAPVAVGIAWRFFLNTEYGTMSYLLRVFGIAENQVWLARVVSAKWVLAGIDVWWATPFVMLVVLAGLKSLPQEAFESATIDGASAWQSFLYLTLPMLKPVFLVVLVFRTMDALRVYDLVYVLTFGGPGTSTSSLSFHIYRTGFEFYEMGYATALGMLFLAFIVLVTLGFVRLLRTEIEF
jgi:multiple sugar transport system permease protein